MTWGELKQGDVLHWICESKRAKSFLVLKVRPHASDVSRVVIDYLELDSGRFRDDNVHPRSRILNNIWAIDLDKEDE